MHRFFEKHFGLLAAVPILSMAALQVASIRLESQTFDEGVHLAAGYRYWRTGDFSLNAEHPPLQKLLSAAPLLVLRPPLPADPKLLFDQSEYARAFLYRGPVDADRMLFLGRLPVILLSIMLGIAVAWTARRYFGAMAALPAVWLCALDPNLIAHGRYITTDMASALFFFLAVVLWVNTAMAPSPRRAAWAGLALGLALASKFSMLLLLPLLPALFLLHWLCERTTGWRFALLTAGVLFALLLVAVFYAPESWRVLRGRPIHVGPETFRGITLPAHTYLTGLRTVLEHNSGGHPAFLLGSVSETGWWYYFPVVFLLKSPVALLLLVALAAGIGLWKFPALFRDPRAGFLWAALTLAPLAYFGVTLTSRINLGVRHLLPIYPFLYILGIAAVARVLPARRFLILAALLAAAQLAETAAVYPEYLAFFNTPAGGPKAGPRYLLDSNLDWGQDLKKLKAYIEEKSPGTVCLEYFGYADAPYYGIRAEYLPKTWDKDDRERVDCIGAISVTLLHDLYIRPGSYAWLRERAPIGAVGSSIYLYDLRKRALP